MTRRFLHSKIHRAHVTKSDKEYVGSITLPPELMEAVDIGTNEQVAVWNVTNGKRFVTYAIPAPAGSGEVCINGAAAHRADEGDIVIVATFCDLDSSEIESHKERVVLVGEHNLDFKLK